MPQPPPRSTLFPYTTLFRSESVEKDNDRIIVSTRMASLEELYLKLVSGTDLEAASSKQALSHESAQGELRVKEQRSEEHTSELQSRPHLVCRLLLEKKKKNQ